MKVLKITDILGINSTTDQQTKIHSGEAFTLWQHLAQRYDIFELTDIFENFANDVVFKAILALGLKSLNDEITQIENELNKYGISLPLGHLNQSILLQIQRYFAMNLCFA